jgi:exonuclease SbcD
VGEEQVAQVDTARLRDALAPAAIVTGIERAVTQTERKRRTVVTRESGLEDAVRQYVGQHDELAGMEEALVDAALALKAELKTEQSGTD